MGGATPASRGRFAGSASACHVAFVPGASSAAVSTCRARESSLCRTLAHVRWRLRSDSTFGSSSANGSGVRPRGLAAARSCFHSPRGNAVARAWSVARPCDPCCSGRANSMRGASRKSFQALEAVGAVPWPAGCAARKLVRAVVNALRTAARMKGGTSCRVGTGCRNSSLGSTSSKVSQAASLVAVAGGGHVAASVVLASPFGWRARRWRRDLVCLRRRRYVRSRNGSNVARTSSANVCAAAARAPPP